MSNHIYGIIYHRPAEDGRAEEWTSAVVIAESYWKAEKAADENREAHWRDHDLHSVTYLTPIDAEAGKVFIVSAT